jgi:hypothetical protein
MLYALAKHFVISQEEAQTMSGNQFTLVNRVAWCDAHLSKAGFVQKRQHADDSMQDTFTITALGVREMNRHPAQITVGYLQSFYRGKVYRGAGSDDATSEAELELYQRFEELPDEFTVFHAVKWFAKVRGTVGEADFIIAHRDRGVLVLEVKGGEISMQREGNNSVWYSRDRGGRLHDIHNPCEQAERNRRALRVWLEDDPRTRGMPYAVFPAVALPDSRVDRDIRPDCPQDIFIDLRHLADLPRALHRIYDYWVPRADAQNQVMDGQRAVDALVDLLVPTRTLGPKVADIFERERRKIDELTEQQFTVLRLLRRHRRAAIVGGAGTGKTMLAMEKAQQLADGGFHVLFLCFNKHLAEWIGKHLAHQNIQVCTFHSLVGQAIHWAKMRGVPNNPQEFMDHAPDLLMDALSIVRAPDSDAHDKLFDAVIVDEAQDFEDTWWVPLPDLLKDPAEGVLYVFFDDNQRLYRQIGNIPIEDEPFFLDENCRNTQHVHAAMLPYMSTLNETTCRGPEGRPVEIVPASDPASARHALQRVLHRLVVEEGISAKDLVVLTPASEKRSQWKTDDQLGRFILTWNPESTMQDAILVSTIYRFKGLECAVVILTELGQRREAIGDQLIYVGLSRARHHAVVIGQLPPANPPAKSPEA